MYILPRNDKEMQSVMDMENLKGRHNVIMNIKDYLQKNESLDLDTFVDMVTYFNKRGWPNWC